MTDFANSYLAAPAPILAFTISDPFFDFDEGVAKKFGLDKKQHLQLTYLLQDLSLRAVVPDDAAVLSSIITVREIIGQPQASQLAHLIQVDFLPLVNAAWREVENEKWPESREAVFRAIMDQAPKKERLGEARPVRPSLEQLIRAKANRVTIDKRREERDKKQGAGKEQLGVPSVMPRRIPIEVAPPIIPAIPIKPPAVSEPSQSSTDPVIERIRSILQETTAVETKDQRQETQPAPTSFGGQARDKRQEVKSEEVQIINKPPATPLPSDETIDLSHL